MSKTFAENYTDFIRGIDDATSKWKEMLHERVKEETDFFTTNSEAFEYLYPVQTDPNFSVKLMKKKEFNSMRSIDFGRVALDADETQNTVQKIGKELCESQFELSPHQMFVRNFLSSSTPYNSLLLYHGVGTGKTCSAITVAEEFRSYMKQIGSKEKIIVIASSNVQQNFKRQLFDETKLTSQNGLWNIDACTGNKFIEEVNPLSLKEQPKQIVIQQIERIIRENYTFLGYESFANIVDKAIKKPGVNEKDNKSINEIIKREFSNRLIIIDEVHNMRVTGDSNHKRSLERLNMVAKATSNLKLLLLSATPMYNNHREIIWLLNLMNTNDGNPPVLEKKYLIQMVISKKMEEKY